MSARQWIVGLGLILFSGAASADLALSTSYVSFPATEVGGGYGPTSYIYVRNSGQEAVSAQVNNGCFTDFRVTSFCGHLQPGQQCQISVQFTPSREGYMSCSIYLYDGHFQYSISVNGQGYRR